MSDVQLFSDWIGREQHAEDLVTERLVDAFGATLSPHLSAGSSTLLLHWCLTTPTVPVDQLDEDGHPPKGGFLPPIPFPRRMWGAGDIRFHDVLRVGDTVTRLSRITSVELKRGSTGQLYFVNIEHAFGTGRGPLLQETQTIVYRDADAAVSPRKAELVSAHQSIPVRHSSVRLFRYSALTFNSHRIHFDHCYATGTEGYAGLVVHGPLQATMLAHAIAKHRAAPLKGFRFRAVSPLISSNENAVMHVSLGAEEDQAVMCNSAGAVTMQAYAW